MNNHLVSGGSQYTFSAPASRLWEFINLPRMSKSHINALDPKDIDVYSTIDNPEYKQVLEDIKCLLEPYASEIKKYYFEESTHLVSLLHVKINLFEFKDLYDFLNECLTKSITDLRTAILYSIITSDNYAGFQDDLWKQAAAAAVAEDSTAYMSILNDYDLSAETKWHLLVFLQTPYLVINQYADLMKQIEPIFNTFYEPYEEALLNDGEAFFEQLMTLGDSPFSLKSQGIIHDDLIPEGPITILYSYVFAYAISLYPSIQAPFLVWGSEVEKLLTYMKDYFKEQQMERLQMFKNLGDKTRYDVLKCVANGTTSTKVIAEQLGVTSATVSYHLNSLTSVKLILLVQQDKKLIQTLNKELMREHIEALKNDFGL